MIVLGIDPGAAGAGYAVFDSDLQRHTYIDTTLPLAIAVDAIVVESGFIGCMGKKAMWGLGFDAGWRLCEALLSPEVRADVALYTIRPDGANGWRAALPLHKSDVRTLDGRVYFARYDGLPGGVIVGRLRLRYGLDLHSEPGASVTEHEVEACGIAEAAAAILARPKAKDRKALKAVKR